MYRKSYYKNNTLPLGFIEYFLAKIILLGPKYSFIYQRISVNNNRFLSVLFN